MTFGQLVKEARHERKESQPTVAQRASISRVALSFIENDRAEPGLFTALRLIRALGIDPEWLGDVLVRPA